MLKLRKLGLTLVMTACLTAPGMAILAQDATEEPTPIPPPTFTDGRISETAGLGGLALFCVNSAGNTHVDSFEDGAITVWGVGDQKYIELSASELRGGVEVPQEPSVLEVQGNLTDEAPAMDATDEPEDVTAVMPEATPLVLDQTPILLARASTPNGEIGFFSLSNDTFALQGHDDKGAFFTYTWTGCSNGVIEHATAPFESFLETVVVTEATEETDMPEMATPEVTEGS